MTTDNRDDSNQFLHPDDKEEEEEEEEELVPDEGLAEDFEPSLEQAHEEIETPIEQLDQHEVVDDPVRMYLHEIGRVSLLTAQVRQSLQHRYGRPPSATEIMVAILKELTELSAIIPPLQKNLGLEPNNSFVGSILDNKLRANIWKFYFFNIQLVEILHRLFYH